MKLDLYLLNHPESLEQIPNNAVLILLPEDDPELANINLRIAKQKTMPDQPTLLAYISKKQIILLPGTKPPDDV